MVNPVVPVIKTNRNPLLGHLVSHTNRHYPNTMFNGPPLRHKSNVDVEYQTEWIKLNIWHQFKMPHPHMKLVGTRVSTRVRAEGLVKGSEIKTCTNDSYFMGHPIPTLLLRAAILIAPCRLVEIGRRFGDACYLHHQNSLAFLWKIAETDKECCQELIIGHWISN